MKTAKLDNGYYTPGSTCPICGCKIKLPYWGQITEDQIREDWKTCQWMEVVDEGRSTIGYTPICHANYPDYDKSIYYSKTHEVSNA